MKNENENDDNDNDKPMKVFADLQPPESTQYPGTVCNVTVVYDPRMPKQLRLAVEGFRNITPQDFKPIQQGGDSGIIGVYQDADGALWYLAHESTGTTAKEQWIIMKAAEPADSPA